MCEDVDMGEGGAKTNDITAVKYSSEYLADDVMKCESVFEYPSTLQV